MLNLELQPEARIAMPERGSSLPSVRPHPSGPLHDVSPPDCLPDMVMEPRAPKRFPWAHLPQHIQQRILSHAVLPDGPGNPLVIGDPDHSAHLQKVAVPIFLALGSWSRYLNGVCVLYRDVHVDLCAHRRSSMNFLTSHRTLRPRGMVVKLRMSIDIKKSLPLFDTGHTIRQSKGKLIKMNVPTALRCMKLHWRLSELEILIDSLATTAEATQNVPENYLPLAEIQLVNRSVLQVFENHIDSLSVGKRPDVGEAETIIAPAFLACRAWQSGFLPLFEDGMFQGGVSLGLVLDGRRSDQKRTVDEDNGRVSRIDGASLMRYWLGGTIVELLDETMQPSIWIDPFTLSVQRADDIGGAAFSVANLQSEPLSHENAVVDSIEYESNMAPSPSKTTDSSFEAAWKIEESESVEPHIVMSPRRRLDDAPKPSKGYNTPSEDRTPSDEVEMRTLHQRFGVGSKVHESMSSVSPSSSKSAAGSVQMGGIASPSSNIDLGECCMVSRRSVSLGEDQNVDSSAACLTEDCGHDVPTRAKHACDPRKASCRSCEDRVDVEPHQVPVTPQRTHREAVKMNHSSETTDDQLSGSLTLDRVESAAEVRKCGMFPPVDQDAESSVSATESG